VYLGFLPRKDSDRQRLLASVAREPRTLVAFEAPHRLLDALRDIESTLGDRPVAVARELTKLHEEIFRGRASAAWAHFAQKEILGEITLVIGGAPEAAQEPWDETRVRAEVEKRVNEGMKKKEAARRVAELSGWPVREVYKLTEKS
jgi:16S rRNA (cytidine1402-2'-O)-methyltransferase